MGCVIASYALRAKATMDQGTVLFTGDAATKQLMLAFIWPLTTMYIISYYIMFYCVVYSLNQDLKRQMKSPVEESTVTEPTQPLNPNMN
jgi:hypothetical protein